MNQQVGCLYTGANIVIYCSKSAGRYPWLGGRLINQHSPCQLCDLRPRQLSAFYATGLHTFIVTTCCLTRPLDFFIFLHAAI